MSLPVTGLEDVSRETLARLESYVATLLKWNPRINLVAPATLDTLWTRHILDSAQIFKLADDGVDHWADLGSGGGFPGLVVAILSAEKAPQLRVTLVESDQRKATFLRTVLRETGVTADVRSERIESLEPLNAQVLSARALAPLPRLLEFASRHLAKDGIALFQKGATWQKEIAAAREMWQFDLTTQGSLTDADAVVLKIGAVHHV